MELSKREVRMQQCHGEDDASTDQWRASLRLCLQAAAGTGKSFLWETLFLWCHLNGHTVRAAAPTGIAAARLRAPQTPIHATTLRYLFA